MTLRAAIVKWAEKQRLFEIHETESEYFNIRLPDRLPFGHPGLIRHAVASRRYGRDLRVVSAARRELRSADVRGILVYRADYHCSHSIAINADQWPDDIRLSDSVSISTLPIAIDSHLEGPNRSRKFAGINSDRTPMVWSRS
jgi:hypothetical protein